MNRKIVPLLLAAKAQGVANSLRVLWFTLQRHRQDWAYWRRYPRGSRSSIGELLSANPTRTGCQFQFRNADLEIKFLSPDVARISWGPGCPPVPYAVQALRDDAVKILLKESENGYQVASSEACVEVETDGRLTFKGQSEAPLRMALPPVRLGTGWVEEAILRDEEHIYGLGLQADGLDLRNSTHSMWNIDPGGTYGLGSDPLYMPLPVYTALHSGGSYLIFYENHYPAVIGSAGEPGNETYRASFESGLLRYYLFFGPIPKVLERFTQLTGRPPLPPRWSLGYHQSRWGYKSQAEILDIAEGFRSRNLRLSAIHLDLDFMDDRQGFTIDPVAFPDFPAMAAELKQAGIHLVTIIDPGVKVKRGYTIYDEGLANGAFCTNQEGKPISATTFSGWSNFPDFTDPGVRLWWGSLYSSLLDAGADGFWHDMNEPTAFNAWGGHRFPLAAQHCLEGEGGDHRRAHNLYGLQMNRAGYEGLRKLRPYHRPWILSRSGWVGNQRYAWNWTADTESTWVGMHTNLTSIIGLGLSGIPYSGPDIGGFSGDPTPELHLRWFQMSAFLPFFRTHSALITARREPWVFGEPYTCYIRSAIELRYQLMPYIYTLAWEASQKGYPLARPLFWNNPEDRRLWDEDTSFLFGDALLVAPVLSEGCSSQRVVFPEGTWYNFWDGTTYIGPSCADIPVSLENIPVFVRAGSVVPMTDGTVLVLHVYAGDGESLIYSDAGDGYEPGRVDRLTQVFTPGELMLNWQWEGEYSFPYPGIKLVVHGIEATQGTCDGKELNWVQELSLPSPFHQIRLCETRPSS